MLMFGADPEYFATYTLDGKEFVMSPALMEKDYGLKQVDGDIKHPIYIKTPTYSWMMDGVAWELTLLQPHENLMDAYRVIRKSLQHLGNFLSAYKLNLYTKPVINIEPEKYLPHLGNEKIYQGFIFGCDPDEDAEDLNYKCQTIDVKTHTLRYGGGHIHVSGSDLFRKYPKPMIKLLACTVGNFVTANSPVPDLERDRAKNYGRPVRFRRQEYKNNIFGVEYRTPSNSWTSFSESKIEELEYWIRKASYYLENQEIGTQVLNTFKTLTYESIINCDQDTSAKILAELL